MYPITGSVSTIFAIACRLRDDLDQHHLVSRRISLIPIFLFQMFLQQLTIIRLNG